MKNKSYYLKIVIIGFMSGICNGIFGSGGGMILVPGMTVLLKFPQHKAHATAVSVILPLACISSYVYISSGKVNLSFDIYYIIAGGLLGSFIGAKLMNKISSKFLSEIFSVFMFIAAIRMIF